MDKTKLKRHNLVFLSEKGKEFVLQCVNEDKRTNEMTLSAAKEILYDVSEIPGIIRRGECLDDDKVAVGFVHCKRVDGNRLRIGSYVASQDITKIVTVYEVIHYHNDKRNKCMAVVDDIKKLADTYGLEVGVLGSAGLELITGLPYTDENSDIDILVKPAEYKKLFDFYEEAKRLSDGINMDFELDLPNGYGIKLAEVFMNTSTVLGKSLQDVDLIDKKEVLAYLE